MRLIDADDLKARTTDYDEEGCRIWHDWDIDNTPTVNVEMSIKFFNEFMKIWKESDFPEELEMYTSDLLIQLGINEVIDNADK